MSKRGLVVSLALVVAAATVGGWVIHRRPAANPTATRSPGTVTYHCPMHPRMVSDRPGDCPICAMRMVPMEGDHAEGTMSSDLSADPSQSHAAPSSRKIVYRSTMNPGEFSDRPGKDSMGMDMVPVEQEEPPAQGAATVPGLSTVRLSDAKRQLIGVKTSLVTRALFERTIRAVGRVALDETRLRHVHTKIAGYVEKLHANVTGELVHEGQPLLEIYSPELLASQQEYLVALQSKARTAGSSIPAVASAGDSLVASARRRLELYDLSEDQIRELETTGKARRTVTLYAPISGTILERMVTQGQRIEPGMDLLSMADLSRVWVLASVYEYELPFVRQAQKATMTLSYLPGETFEGRVSLVYPVLDPATRTAQVRIEFENGDLALKPDMYAQVTLVANLGERTAVPASAVMDTGNRSIVFVDKGRGYFEPREVRIGLRLPDTYEVLGGLEPDESVLTSANFFVDSESKLKAALAAMASDSPAPATSQHQH
jgi:RND family efflux transporter MFP subunit